MQGQWDTFDLVEAFQLSQAVATLHDLDILTTLHKPATVDELSAKFAIDAGLLRGILDYLALRTNLLRRSGERFVATQNYSAHARFLLDLYLGAYGRNATQLSKLLRNPARAPNIVDRTRYARAFDAVNGPALGAVPQIIRQLEFNYLLDLGCGNGELLLDLAKRDRQFVGWGIELSPAMCKVAQSRIRRSRLGKRLQVLEGDCRKLRSSLPEGISSQVRTVTACNVANEMFANGHLRAISWLRGMRKVLPGRPLIIADYYGRLGHKKDRSSRETILHDYAQLISGQGVPPASAAEWRSIYSRAGCRLVSIIEDKATTRFVHIVEL